ncbi:MAG: Lipolytic protein G-D-S-L family [Planctomycetota bacterium]|nr:MAG: Lipolytic protein G-D-S-L family [Planctomycetota bacterium]
MILSRTIFQIVFCASLLGGLDVRAADFALRDGDTVVFLGDSLTAARTYGKFIESYTLLRYPDRKVRFINAGFGGDTAEGGLKRLERDVFAHKATVLTVAFGTNDIGWGVYADEVHKKKYLDAVRGIVTACRERGVRVYLCSAAVTGADPAKSEDSFLQKMCDEGMSLSKSLGGEAIDVQRSMREVQKRVAAWNEKVHTKEDSKKDSLHVADGVHLNDLGQLAMAFAILKGLGAPADVSSATLDFADGKLVAADDCEVTKVRREEQRLEFTRLDEGLPFNHGIFFALHYRFVPVPSELNRYMLTVKNLPAGKYDVSADDRAVGSFTAAQLSEGVNIASTTAVASWRSRICWDDCISLTVRSSANSQRRQRRPTNDWKNCNVSSPNRDRIGLSCNRRSLPKKRRDAIARCVVVRN